MPDKEAFYRFLGLSAGVLIFSLIFGLIVWSVQIRVLKVTNLNSETEFVLVQLTDVDENSEVVFQYPHVESPLYVGQVQGYEKNKGFLLKTDQAIHLPRELILGLVLLKF